MQFEASVREATLEVPDTACTVAVSLDGVMAPMKGEGGGYREASCASVSLYDGEGERLATLRMARMPEEKKATLKTMVAAEVEAVLGQRPELKLVKIADGAKDNWTFLGKVLPEGVELIDFFHAAEHLKDGFDAAYGADDPKADGAVREVPSCAAPRHRRGREGHPGTAPSALDASAQRTGRASARLLPQQSASHGLRRGEGPGLAHWLRGGRDKGLMMRTSLCH